MILEPSPKWQRRRTAFNHDWLKNEYLPALQHWQRLLNAEVKSIEFERTFLHAGLPAWESMRLEADEIVASVASEMSPGDYLRTMCPAMQGVEYDWVFSMVHEAWLRSSRVEQLASTAATRVREAGLAYQALKSALAACPRMDSIESTRSAAAHFRDFLKRAQAVASAVEQLPSRIEFP